MMLPFIDAEENEIQEEQYIPKEYGINFETGQLSGKIVEGFDAILVWAWLALHTARYRYYIYSDDYGQEYDELFAGINTVRIGAHDRGMLNGKSIHYGN